MSELEKRFSPSYWTKRYQQEEAVDIYIKLTTKISKEIMKTIPCILNISYGDGEREKYDIFGVDLPNDAPLLIFLHGGYWQYNVTKEIWNTPARALYRLGIKTLVVGYSLCPEYTVSYINEKVTYAIKKCIEYAKQLGSKSIGIAGHSAGAQIAITSILKLFNSQPRSDQDLFKGVFLLGGIFDLTEIIETSYNDALKLTKTNAKELSPMFQQFRNLHQKSIKIYICVGNYDCPGFIQQSKDFYDVLVDQKLGKQVELMIFDELDHYALTERLDDVDFKIIDIIANTLNKQ